MMSNLFSNVFQVVLEAEDFIKSTKLNKQKQAMVKNFFIYDHAVIIVNYA